MKCAPLLGELENDAYLVEGTFTTVGATKDPKDNMVIACAVEGQADYIVSGDPDLVELGTFAKIQIVSPAEFIQVLRRGQHDQS